MLDTEAVVLQAADTLIDAFMAHDRERYFACFAPEATFLFHTHPARLDSRATYEDLWARWEREDGFRVLGGESSDRRVDILGDIAVFTHSVATRLSMAGQVQSLRERETIVFRHSAGRWLAVHEHLSAYPAG
ncbi:YybH family protein [Inquilinus sp.]|uniref:YybH family protein n=1 Tax=Inquilinus sp. TaxID=1932117 RepID=UPI003784B226